MEQNYRLTIAYDGSRFFGWERQPDKDTIQGKLEAVLGALQGHPVNVIGAGRTDAGVHARAMTANVVLDTALTPEEIRAALDAGTLDRDLRAAFTIAGYIFYASVEKIDRCQVKMLSDIDPSIASRMHLQAFSSLDALLQTVDFSGKDVYVMPFGGFTVPYLKGSV